MENTKIYFLCKKDRIPFYIGKTIRIENNSRLNAHKEKYGKNIFLETIDLVNTDEWEFWEKHYISLFKSWGFILENKNKGGGGCVTHNVLKSSRLLIGKAHKGLKKPFSDIHKVNMSIATKGKIMPKSMGIKISKLLKGRKITWDLKHNSLPLRKKILQYDLNGNFIKEWESITKATKELKCDISGFLRGRYKHSGGFIWKYGN